MRDAILTTISTKIKICSDVMAHSLVNEYQGFNEKCCLLLQGIKLYTVIHPKTMTIIKA
jgi:hypothetical protein